MVIDLNELEQVIKDKGKTEHEASLLLQTDRIKLLTRLSKEEVTDISSLYFISEMLELNEFENLLDNLVMFKVSEGGKGRKELVDVLKAKSESAMNKMMGGFGNGFNR